MLQLIQLSGGSYWFFQERHEKCFFTKVINVLLFQLHIQCTWKHMQIPTFFLTPLNPMNTGGHLEQSWKYAAWLTIWLHNNAIFFWVWVGQQSEKSVLDEEAVAVPDSVIPDLENIVCERLVVTNKLLIPQLIKLGFSFWMLNMQHITHTLNARAILQINLSNLQNAQISPVHICQFIKLGII
jgi:hypothetical protein